MEREILMTGIGGQGVQLAARILAEAALHEGREVMLFGTYGGTMRGGQTDSTIVVADGPISAPPVVSSAWAALVMHPRFFPPLAAKLRPGAVAVLNETLFEGELDREALRVFEVPATRMGSEQGSPQSSSLILLAAFARATGVVERASLVEAMRAVVPARRAEHLEANDAALAAGWEALPAGAAPAWEAAA